MYKIIKIILFIGVLGVIIKIMTMTPEERDSGANDIMKEKEFCSTLERKFIDKSQSSSKVYVFENGDKFRLMNSWFRELYDIFEVGDSACKEIGSLDMKIIKVDTTFIYSLDYHHFYKTLNKSFITFAFK